MTSLQLPWERVVWAVDTFAKEPELQRLALLAFRLLAGEAVSVEPVYLLRVPPNKANDGLSQIEEKAQARLGVLTSLINYKGLLPLKVVRSLDATLRAEAQILIEYAKKSGAKLIVVSTHAKKGPYRWLVGSFAEMLMLHSDVPLLIVNPAWRPRAKIDEILYPTDFSKESREAFEHVIALAKGMNQSITLFHKVPSPGPAFFDTELIGYPLYEVTIQAQIEFVQSRAREWSEYATSKGVKSQIQISSKFIESPADAILDYSERRSCLIAMAARSGPISAALLGGTTRRVVRNSTVPVWVLHPSSVRESFES